MKAQGALLLSLSLFLDGLIVGGSFAVIWVANGDRDPAALVLALLVLPLWTRLLRHFGLYQSHRLETLRGLTRKVLSVQAIGGSTLGVAALVLRSPSELPLIGWFVLVSSSLLLCQKWLVYGFLHMIRQRGFDARNVCVIGDAQVARRLSERAAAHPHWGMRVVCVGDGPPLDRQFWRLPDGELCGRTLREALAAEVIDEVVIACTPDGVAAERETIDTCDDAGIMARVMLEGRTSERVEPRLEEVYGQVTVALAGQQRDQRLLLLKRATDVVLACILLVVAAPLFLVVAGLVKLSSPGPVLFRQVRVGLHGRHFRLLKFRTMVEEAETQVGALAHRSITGGPVFKDPTDLRITEIGRVLRRLSIDELPQLVNVLFGDMSLVGPRPLPLHESIAITGSHRRRFSMRPGLTCLWQVNGRSNVDYERWMQYDLDYVDGWSLALDARLLVRTIPVVLSGRGAY